MISAPYLADAVSCGLVLLDCQGRVLLWNKWMVQYSARNADEALGVSLDEACGVRIEQRIHMAIREALDFGLASLFMCYIHPLFRYSAVEEPSALSKRSLLIRYLQIPENAGVLFRLMM